MADLNWVAEDERLHWLDLNGIYATITKREDGPGWFWRVDPSQTRTECPEVYDCGSARTLESAKNKAEAKAKKADASYQHRPEVGYW